MVLKVKLSELPGQGAPSAGQGAVHGASEPDSAAQQDAMSRAPGATLKGKGGRASAAAPGAYHQSPSCVGRLDGSCRGPWGTVSTARGPGRLPQAPPQRSGAAARPSRIPLKPQPARRAQRRLRWGWHPPKPPRCSPSRDASGVRTSSLLQVSPPASQAGGFVSASSAPGCPLYQQPWPTRESLLARGPCEQGLWCRGCEGSPSSATQLRSRLWSQHQQFFRSLKR